MKAPVRTRLPFIIITWTAFALRLHRVTVQELRGDEAFSYFFSRTSLPEIIRATLRLGEPHPVGSYVLLKAWMGVAGDSVLSLRFPSIWCGTLAVVLLYALMRGMRLREAALPAAGLMALSPYALWHSQDARMYSCALMLTLLSTQLLLRWIRTPSRSVEIAYVLITWLGLHMHYYAIFVVLAQAAFVLVLAYSEGRGFRRAWRWLRVQGVVGLLYAPWIWVAWPVMRAYRGTGESPSWQEMAWRSFSALAVGESAPWGERRVFAVVGGLIVVGGLWILWRGGKSTRWALYLLGLYLFLPLLLSWYAARGRPLFNERYLVLGAPPFYALGGVVAAQVLRRPGRTGSWTPARWGSIAMAAILTFLLLLGTGRALGRYFYDPEFDKIAGWRDLVTTLRRWSAGQPPERVRIVQDYPDPTLWYYYRGPIPHVVIPPTAHDAEGSERAVEELVAAGVTWVLLPEQPNPAWDDAHLALRSLRKWFHPVREKQVHGWRVYLFARPAPRAWRTLNVTFRNGMVLEAIQVQPVTPTIGGTLVIHTRWRSRTRPNEALKMFVHLVPKEGDMRPRAQCDPPLQVEPKSTVTVSCGIPLENVLPGDYRLLVGMYEAHPPNYPRVLTAEGKDAVGAGTLSIRPTPTVTQR